MDPHFERLTVVLSSPEMHPEKTTNQGAS